jgi:hypothetical protein
MTNITSMNTYNVKVFCHRLGSETEELVRPTDIMPSNMTDCHKKLIAIAEEQHNGQCGNRHDPCLAEAISIDCHHVFEGHFYRHVWQRETN